MVYAIHKLKLLQEPNEIVNNHKPFRKFRSANWLLNRDPSSPCSFYVRSARTGNKPCSWGTS